MRLRVDRERGLAQRRSGEGCRSEQQDESGDRHGAAERRCDLEREEACEQPEHELGCDEDGHEHEGATRNAPDPEAPPMGDEAASDDGEIGVERTRGRAWVGRREPAGIVRTARPHGRPPNHRTSHDERPSAARRPGRRNRQRRVGVTS